MTVSEFKAWLEGFEEAMGGNPPSAEQWKSIKAKLAKVNDRPPVAVREPRATWMSGPLVGH
ncbi:hypothetical protein [Rhizobium sp.]|uniref:hypothetical protein n=1 Tax=Rhizobium sp. TaxID=391 RepID=UPI0028A18326